MSSPVLIRARRSDIARAVVAVGDPERAEQLSALLKEVRLVNSNRSFLTYTGYYDDKPVTVATHGIGGPSSAIIFEELRMLGARSIVRLGTTGAITRALGVGDFVVPTGAAHAGGSLKMYVPDGVLPAVPDLHLTSRIAEFCRAEGEECTEGLVFSSDAFYSENPRFLKEWVPMGVIAVEMECATLFTLGLIRKFKASSLLVVTDSLVKRVKEMTTAREIKGRMDKAGRIVLRSLTAE
jgi:5'-methylthioadenosine phosphorylase